MTFTNLSDVGAASSWERFPLVLVFAVMPSLGACSSDRISPPEPIGAADAAADATPPVDASDGGDASVSPDASDGGDASVSPDASDGGNGSVVSAGGSRTCALRSGSVKCWGRNSYGQLGLGDTNNRGGNAGEMGDSLPAINLGTGRSALAIAMGDFHSCALLDNNAVKCWGHNSYGGLGLGDANHRGDNAGEMGDSLPAVNLGTGRSALAIAPGGGHTCALLDNNAVKCWGYNSTGELGLGDTNHRGDNAGEMGDSLPAINLGTGRSALAIATGERYTCALLDNNAVKCWGFNSNGELGLGDTNRRGNNAGEMGDSLPAVNLGTGRSALAIAAGAGHTCAVLDNNAVKCWGRNSYGQLGLGDTNHRGDTAGEMGDSLPAVNLGTGRSALAIAMSEDHACAVLDNNAVKCWGYNSTGELGLGDTNSRGDNAGEMGDSLPAVSLGK